MPQPLTLPTPTLAWKPTYWKLCSRVKEQPKYPLFPQIPSTHRRTRFHTRSTCVPLYWPSLLLFLNGILKAMFTAKLCALWSLQERQQILKYWLLSLLEERASSRREREAEMGGKDTGMDRQTNRWKEMSSGGCCQILDKRAKFTLTKYVFAVGRWVGVCL